MGLGTFLASWGLSSSECAEAFEELTFPTACVKELIGLCLNYAILLGGLVVRLPQLFRVWKTHSVVGISEASVLVEALGAWLFVAYNILQRHAFATWGETLFIAIQHVLLVSLYWRFSRVQRLQQRRSCMRWAAGLFALSVVCYAKLLPLRASEALENLLGVSPLPLMLLARIPQIIQNWKQTHTGQLSLLSLSLTLLGTLARLATVLQQVPDGYILASCLLAVLLNLVLTIQILYYSAETEAVLQREAARKVL